MALIEKSPLTGIIDEDQVFLDFGEHEGKSITPEILIPLLVRGKNNGNVFRSKLHIVPFDTLPGCQDGR